MFLLLATALLQVSTIFAQPATSTTASVSHSGVAASRHSQGAIGNGGWGNDIIGNGGWGNDVAVIGNGGWGNDVIGNGGWGNDIA